MTHTRKHKKAAMTIPQLRKAFDHIEAITSSIVTRERDPVKRRKAFQAEWMKVFHRSVDDKSADAYLQFESKKTKKTLKARRGAQRGGDGLSGAPLDYSTRPGIYGVYGEFPEYISGGFATMGNATNTMAIQARCNSPQQAAAFPPPYTGFGAASLAQKGGKQSKKSRKGKKGKTRKMRGGATWGEFASAMTLRPLTASAPPSQLHTALMDWRGGEPLPSSLANTGSPAYQHLKPMTQVATVGAITRDLGSEI
jgi:hypothetical protein